MTTRLVRGLRFLRIDVLQTLLRVLPFPCRTGLRRIGNPGRQSPVLLTCNFALTVERLTRAIQGIDAWLLVANSRGVNVWCAATGGLLTHHDVISVLETSGVADQVDHRRVILPQLAATGIDGKVVHRKTGWRVVWGPVRAESIPAFLAQGMETDRAMRTVAFPARERLEMAISWAFPLSLLALLLIPIWAGAVLPLVGLVWSLSFVVFLAFPWYEGGLRGRGQSVGFVFFDFGERGVLLLLWMVFLGALVAGEAFHGGLSAGVTLRWGVASLVVLAVLGLDLMGSTPVYKSGLHGDRLLSIELDEARCKGAAFCAQVCPKDVFEIDDERRMATLPRADQCVQCGACIVQCPFDALLFRSPAGDVIDPETVRRFKLNLLGTRTVRTSGT